MKILGVIPARYASSRFPGKPLVDIGGKSMIQRVFEQASRSGLSEVVVATDDDRIVAEVIRFGGNYVRTRDDHQSGTDRCAEVAAAVPEYDVIINIQGDEPFIEPDQISLVAKLFDTAHAEIGTLVKEIETYAQLIDPNTPKVALRSDNTALYFSRQPIPYHRSKPLEEWLAQTTYYRHIGIYGYRSSVLAELTKLPVGLLEQSEQLEQLRWLEHGYRIHTATTKGDTLAVDTPEDLERIREKYL